MGLFDDDFFDQVKKTNEDYLQYRLVMEGAGMDPSGSPFEDTDNRVSEFPLDDCDDEDEDDCDDEDEDDCDEEDDDDCDEEDDDDFSDDMDSDF